MSTMVERRPALTDSEIHCRVIDELKWDAIVDETSVGVEVDRGVVTLTGTVKSYAEKTSALHAAHRVRGVLDVANDVKVIPMGSFERTDTEIAQAARDALVWDVLVPSERIQSTVANGWITLNGGVDSWLQREAAGKAVRYLFGVRGVTNSVEVKPAPVQAADIRSSIEKALERQAEREARDIVVNVHEGTVTLSGRVQSWHERRAIVGCASHAAGVQSVVDHLRVDPYA